MIALGQIPLALLLAVFIGRGGNRPSMASGARLGAMFGFLLELGVDLTMYGTTNVANLTATLVDPFVTLVQGAVTGAVIGLVLGAVRGTAAA